MAIRQADPSSGQSGTRRRNARTWFVSIAATVVSTYALDATATAAGIGLVASGLFADAGRPWAVAVLVASYVGWGFGLRANVRANGMLLATTGTSTNVLSKAAHDLTRRLTDSDRAPRRAAAIGYLGAELIKEAPYYLGAFGVAAVSTSVSSHHAIVFLAGTNVGAMLYEYGLARLTRVVLRRRWPAERLTAE
jgi:hypothetical protein